LKETATSNVVGSGAKKSDTPVCENGQPRTAAPAARSNKTPPPNVSSNQQPAAQKTPKNNLPREKSLRVPHTAIRHSTSNIPCIAARHPPRCMELLGPGWPAQRGQPNDVD
ncbi:hypothetical protein, partial [Cupriavidus basilensis]|uniref:hypothetical protein n=1 Tax=Cupriavidus basilensis TaxID=68895 RepID=UPI0023E7E9D0